VTCFLGVDIGTYETKGVLVDSDGAIIASAARPHKMLVPQPGWAEHRPDEDWWGDFVFVTRALLAESRIDPKSIRAVGCSAIGPCMLPVDSAGNALMNGVLYGVDTRAAEEIAELEKRIGHDRLIAECGNPLTSQSVGPKILWLKNNRREIYDRAARIVTSSTYLVQKLTGRCVIDHYTAANFSPLYLVDDLAWSSDLAGDIIDLDRLPEILWSTEIAGEVTGAAAAETGLSPGTPVLAGTIDAAAEAVSVGVIDDGQMMLMYGSTIFIIMPTDRRVTDKRLWYAPWLFEGMHASMAGLATSGTLTRWFGDQFAKELEEGSFGLLEKEGSESPPGARGLVMLPYFSGERTPIHDPNARGVIFGLDLTHTRGDVYRALLEGIAFGTRHVIETYRDAGIRPQTLHAVGGGTKNPTWSQATSDICGMSQIVRRRTIGAAYGDAFLCAVATGHAKPGDIDEWNPVEREIEPDPEYRDVYDRRYRVFRELYGRTRDLMADVSK